MVLKINDSVLAHEEKPILTEIVFDLFIAFATLSTLRHSNLEYCSIETCGTSLNCHLVFIYDAKAVWHVNSIIFVFHFVLVGIGGAQFELQLSVFFSAIILNRSAKDLNREEVSVWDFQTVVFLGVEA